MNKPTQAARLWNVYTAYKDLFYWTTLLSVEDGYSEGVKERSRHWHMWEKKKNTWSRPNNSASFLVTGHESLRKQEKRKKSVQKEEKWEQALESSSCTTSLAPGALLSWCSEGSQILSQVSPFLYKLAQDGSAFHTSLHTMQTHTRPHSKTKRGCWIWRCKQIAHYWCLFSVRFTLLGQISKIQC